MTNPDVVYTALFGDYDTLKELPTIEDGLTAICFTDDQSVSSETWEVRYVKGDESPVLMNRRYKLLPHLFLEGFERSLYVDSSIEVVASPSFLFDKYLEDRDIACSRHPFRECIYAEGLECVICGKSPLFLTLKQVRGYRADGYPVMNGLWANGLILRNHHNDEVIQLMEAWWTELLTYTARDQISLPYLAWKNKVEVGSLQESFVESDKYFVLHRHKHESSALLMLLIGKVAKLLRLSTLGLFYMLASRCVNKSKLN